MSRRYSKRRSANRDRYSVENISITSPDNAWTEVVGSGSVTTSKQFAVAVVPQTDVQGMRKVKHFTLSFSVANGDPFLYYALVYVPEGYEPNNIQIPIVGQAVSLYEPNQYVISAGVLDFSGGPCRVKTPLARNLNSGDSIYLVIASVSNSSPPIVRMNIQYAITLQ